MSTLTRASFEQMVTLLRERNAPPHEDGYYRCFVSPRIAVEIMLDQLLERRSQRVHDTAWSILRHERRRCAMGKRNDEPHAREVFDRTLRIEEHAGSHPA